MAWCNKHRLLIHSSYSVVDLTGWPSGRSRRNRPPATPKREDLTAATVHRQIPLFSDAPAPVTQKVIQKHKKRQKRAHERLYHDVVHGNWQPAQAARMPLFGQSHPGWSAGTSALRAKLCPALDTTQNWTRVQRKLLPKYLFVLDAVTARHLLQCCVRLQPPAITQQRPATLLLQCLDDPADVDSNSDLPTKQQQLQNPHDQLLQHPDTHAPLQQQQQGPSLDQLAQLPTCVYGAITGPQAGLWPAPPLTPAQLAAADAAAAAHGFSAAAAERQEFELMLSASYTVLAHKLPHWPPAVLVKLLSCAGWLQLQHHGFLKAWLAAYQPALIHQSGPALFSTMEALSRLQGQPPPHWCKLWQAAMQGRLTELSLTQLAALQLHLLHNKQQPAASWWQQLHAAVLEKVSVGRQVAIRPTANTGSTADVSNSSNLQQVSRMFITGQQQQGTEMPAAGAAVPGRPTEVSAGAGRGINAGALTVTEADALATLLCSCHLVGPASCQPWLPTALQWSLEACQQGSMSTAGALQLLSACCCGACRHLPGAAEAQQACLELLQQRMAKLPSPAGVGVLFMCLQTGYTARRLPAGFVDALCSRLVELLPSLPTDLLLQVPHVLAATPWQGPNERLVASFALASQARLHELGWDELRAMLEGCEAAGLVMPAVWCSAVLSFVDQLAASAQLGAQASHVMQQARALCGGV